LKCVLTTAFQVLKGIRIGITILHRNRLTVAMNYDAFNVHVLQHEPSLFVQHILHFMSRGRQENKRKLIKMASQRAHISSYTKCSHSSLLSPFHVI